jgi:hypothetical protein
MCAAVAEKRFTPYNQNRKRIVAGCHIMDMMEPEFPYELDGYKFVGRGPGKSGWSTSPDLIYRCVKCGDWMRANGSEYFHCKCGAMSLDVDYGRFGSSLGDKNILTYEKTRTK